MAQRVDDDRFLPYLQRHEVEALVLASMEALEMLVDDGVDELRGDLGQTAPEDVNDGPETAPSKRLLRHVRAYDKVVYGSLVVAETGLATVRSRCPGFDAWVSSLEALAPR